MFTKRLELILTTNKAETDLLSDDPRLIGRTYTIPFDRVWTACLDMIDRNRRWTLIYANDLDGYIVVQCQTLVFKFIDDFEITILLDENALTRIDVRSHSRKGRTDLGANARRIGRFFKKLDRILSTNN